MTEEMRKDYEKACEAGREYGKILNQLTSPYTDENWLIEFEVNEDEDGI